MAGHQGRPTKTKVIKKPSAEHIDRILEGVAAWASFYRANPHRFVSDYMRINLREFQKILLTAFNENYNSVYIAARGQGKSNGKN